MTNTARKGNRYRFTIKEVSSEEIDGEDTPAQTLTFELQDREDLFNTVENLKNGSGLEENSATKVAVALRLLGPVMVEQRKHPIFLDFMPHFKVFMLHLKSTVKAALKTNT